jgi:hypothetical protein
MILQAIRRGYKSLLSSMRQVGDCSNMIVAGENLPHLWINAQKPAGI